MSTVSTQEKILRIFGGVLLLAWAASHFFLGSALLRHLPLVGQFFFVDAVLAIVGAVMIFIGIRWLYTPALVFALVNYLLLTESRVYPAPVLGKPLPAVNSYVIFTFGLDILLIVVLTALVLSKK
jgi:hypothetical protein